MNLVVIDGELITITNHEVEIHTVPYDTLLYYNDKLHIVTDATGTYAHTLCKQQFGKGWIARRDVRPARLCFNCAKQLAKEIS